MWEFIFHFIKLFIAVLIGIIYLPLNMLLMKVGDMTQDLKLHHRMATYWIVRIVFFPLWLVVTVLSVPYEMIVEAAH